MADKKIDNVKNISKLFNQKSLLDIAIEMERFLDFMNIYVFPNWKDGEIIDGPNVGRYWLTMTLRYPKDKMPDPAGARVLHDVGVKVEYSVGTEMNPIEIETPEDFRPNSKKPKLRPEKVWHVEIKIPRRFVDEIDYNDLDDIEDDVDSEDINSANDTGLVDDENDQNQVPTQQNQQNTPDEETSNV